MAKVRIPTPLRKLTKGASEVDGAGATVRELFDDLESRYPGLRDKIFEESGEIRRFINIFVNGEDVRFQKGTESPVKADAEVSIVPAIAGGSGATFCLGRWRIDRRIDRRTISRGV